MSRGTADDTIRVRDSQDYGQQLIVTSNIRRAISVNSNSKDRVQSAGRDEAIIMFLVDITPDSDEKAGSKRRAIVTSIEIEEAEYPHTKVR